MADWKANAISKMITCYDNINGYFRANEWLKPYSQTSAMEYANCENCKWFLSCKVPFESSKFCNED